jgi:hypothetical protein
MVRVSIQIACSSLIVLLSINQRKNDEKNFAVKQMRKIYQNASRVIVWLGPDRDGQAELAAETIAKMFAYFLARCNPPEDGLDSVPDFLNMLTLSGLWQSRVNDAMRSQPETVWRALYWYYSHPWFTRTWVIQEVNVKVPISVICGATDMSWNHVTLVASYLEGSGDLGKGNYDFPQYKFDDTNCKFAAAMRAPAFRNVDDFLGTLRVAAVYDVTDPRDRVYGMLGLNGFQEQCNLKPDYNKSKEQIFRELAEYYIRRYNDLTILSFVIYDSRRKRLPSWVPDWSDRVAGPRYRDYKGTWKAAGDKGLSYNFSRPPERHISVSGVQFGQVKYIKLFDSKSIEKLFYTSLRHPESADNLWRHRFWRNFFAAMSGAVPEDVDQIAVCSRVFCNGLDSKGRKLTDTRKHRADFADYLSLVFHGAYSGIPDIGLHTGGQQDVFRYAAWANCREECFFITDQGHIGCGPPALKTGDVVCILFGGYVPYILRTKRSSHFLVGEAFVDGMMEGEVFSNTQLAGHSAVSQEQMFRII